MTLVATLFNGCETALPAFANAYNTFLRDGRYMTLRRFAMHFLCIHTLILFSTEARPVQTQLKLLTSDFYIMHSKLNSSYCLCRSGLLCPSWCPAFVCVCVCVVGVVYLLGRGGGVGSGFFLEYTHVHKRQGLIHCSMAVRPLYPLLLTRTTPSLRDGRYLT